MSRTVTFGEKGVSASQFYKEFLATVRLNDVAVDWAAEDLQYLQVRRRGVGTQLHSVWAAWTPYAVK